MITLELIEKYGPDGWQDDEGVIHYDHEFDTPWGKLGSLVLEHDGEWTIKRADGTVLFNRGFIQGLEDGLEDECTTLRTSALGFKTVLIHAANGSAVYQLHDHEELMWSDTGQMATNQCLGTLNYSDWTSNADD